MPRENKNDSEQEGAWENLQKDLLELQKWATKWKMSFSINKCKIMHLGYGNGKQEYELNAAFLSDSTEEKDLGVLIDNDLNFSRHIKGI